MVLLIGATSFLGPSIMARLFKEGHDVSCLLAPGSNCGNLVKIAKEMKKDILLISGDLKDRSTIKEAVKNADKAIYLVDLANPGLLKNFLSVVKRTHLRRIIFISRTTVLLPINSKVKKNMLESEAIITHSNLDYTILRPSMIYGVKDDQNFSKMVRFIRKWGFFLTFGTGENLIQPVFIDDIVWAVAKVLDDNITYKKIYDLPGREPLRYNTMLDIIKARTGKNFIVLRFPIRLSRSIVSIHSRLSKNPLLNPGQIERMSIDKVYSYQQANEDFGFSPVSFKRGIGELIRRLEF
jgi:nucleoside-diphosphate-sugar epimerase